MVTIYHWDLPAAIQDLGGWTNPAIIDYVTDFAKILFEQYGDRVKVNDNIHIYNSLIPISAFRISAQRCEIFSFSFFDFKLQCLFNFNSSDVDNNQWAMAYLWAGLWRCIHGTSLELPRHSQLSMRSQFIEGARRNCAFVSQPVPANTERYVNKNKHPLPEPAFVLCVCCDFASIVLLPTAFLIALARFYCCSMMYALILNASICWVRRTWYGGPRGDLNNIEISYVSDSIAMFVC